MNNIYTVFTCNDKKIENKILLISKDKHKNCEYADFFINKDAYYVSLIEVTGDKIEKNHNR